MAFQLPFVIDRPYGRVTVVLEVFEENGRKVCGILDIRGSIKVRRRWFRLVRAHLHRIEQIAQRAGCNEIRVAGRNWSRVLTDYEPFGGPENGLRKVL